MTHTMHHSTRALSLATIALLAGACDSPSAPRPSSPVAFRLAANTAVAATVTAAGPLEITSFRLVVGAVSLGSGQQFGCVDCQNDDGEGESPQQLIDVPLGGGTVLVTTEPVSAGRYGEAEISVEQPGASLAGTAAWTPGASMEIVGRVNGTVFRLPLTITGSFLQALVPPIDVSANAAPTAVPVTITLPVASWFTANGTALDPSVPAQRAQIEANARASFQATETEGKGREGSEG
ncbi:MAG: hypothetical protein Q8K55_03995 [Gemmatimonadaceae bacterium]|nr:hypothetical protein [Gemmatimonadaceae bacterium]